MRLLLFIICIAAIYYQNNLIGQTGSGIERNTLKPSVVHSQISQIMDQIDNKSIPIEKILPNIKQLEIFSDEDPYLYLEIMQRVIASLQNRDKDEKAMTAGREILTKAAFIALVEPRESNTARQCDVLFCQMGMLLTRQYRFYRTESLVDCDQWWRRKCVFRLIELYQLILSQIDEDYDPNASENVFITGHNFVPPPSYNGRIIPGKDYSNAEDNATREAYKKYIKEEYTILDKKTAQKKARVTRDHYKKQVQEYIVDAYSLFPYRTSELEQMLTDNKVDSEMAKTILDAVRKAEKEHPDDGFRIWLSKDKMFKTEAKLISADSQDVVLENRNTKRAAIEIDALRQEDQDYIKRQMESESKKSGDDKSKE